MTHAKTVRFAAIIPAYRPEQALLSLVAALAQQPVSAIVLIDDGSGPAYEHIFSHAAAFHNVYVVRHAVNLGKGAALKSGFNYALCNFPDLQGVVTADADGQHHPDDIAQVARALAAEPDRIVLGARTMNPSVPLRSRVGNIVTRAVMAAVVGERVADTQTGLRGIPAAFLPHLMRLEANGYDFELDMLVAVRQRAIRITEVPIRTIYEPGNRTSHFNPLLDSMKIYFVLLRFSSASLMTAALDTLVFYLAYRRSGNLAASQALGRILAVAFNYTVVRRAVFFTKLKHASVLPKYLLLVLLSGTASYAGIQLLGRQFHIQPLPAKLLVETLLFFANFAIQRDFIFGKTPPISRPKPVRPAWIDTIPRWIPPAVLTVFALLLLAVVAYGLTGLDLRNAGWTKIGRTRLIHYIFYFVAASSVVLLTVPWAYPAIVAGLILIATMIALGPLATLAALFFLLSSYALGSRLLAPRDDAPAEDHVCAALLGMAVYIFLMTLLARLPVNYPAAYAIALAIPLLFNLRMVGRRITAWTRALAAKRKRSWRQSSAFALLVFVIGIHWIVVPQPECGADALAMHLAIPVNVSLHHVMTYRPDRMLWSVMPMGVDWCYTIVYLLGGEYAARLLNFAILLLLLALLYRLARRWLSPALAYIVIALFASTSMVQLVTGSLMVENLLAAMILAAVGALTRLNDTGRRRWLYAMPVFAGTALAIKLGGLPFAIALLPFACIEVNRQWRRLGRRPALAALLAVILFLSAAAPTYAIAWRMTGNPIFPFLNDKLPSPILDRSANITDYRYVQKPTWHSPFDLTFHTNRYFEGRAGSLGFQYLLLVPLGLLAAAFIKRPPAGVVAIVSLAAAAAVAKLLPNARYFYPALPLLLLPLAALLGWLAPSALRRALVTLAVLCVLLNTWFLAASNYSHGDFYERSPLSAAMRAAYLHKHAPVREIGQYMNRQHPGAPVFIADGSDIAAFNAEAVTNGWHQYHAYTRLAKTHTADEAYRLLHDWNIRYVVAPKPAYDVEVHPAAIQSLLDACTTPEYQSTGFYLARIEPGCATPQHAQRVPLPMQPGAYDDFDPSIVYDGPWIRDRRFSEPFAHTLTYINVPGATVRFAFNGSLLSYVYTKAANRGIAAVDIDGVRQPPVDLYSAETAWHHLSMFKVPPGRHTATITVDPDKNSKSSDRYIDVDGFVVQ